MIRGYPNQLQTIGRTITFQSLEKSGLVREVTSVDQENKNSSEDVGNRVGDKLVETENKQASEQPIGNSRQIARNRLNQFHYRGNNNNNNNSSDNIKNKSHNYPNELISFFDKENFEHWKDRDKNLDTQKVVFPEKLIFSIFHETKIKNKTHDKTFVPVMPPECHGRTFCDYVPDYPEDIIENLKDDIFLQLFVTGGEPTTEAQRMPDNENFDEKINLCHSTVELNIPKIGMTCDGQYKYILQVRHLKQWFDSEVCLQENESCNYFFPWRLGVYPSTCVQKFSKRKFVNLSHKGEVEESWFNVKSSCSCLYHDKSH
ncbi:GSCOCG00000561001-RA-CDS [Cotesia congregata]|nr:GSCOCG00000561001-RA-CDS [Cotesia congregata]